MILGHACLHEFPGGNTFEVGRFVYGRGLPRPKVYHPLFLKLLDSLDLNIFKVFLGATL